jgi:hypothetical protein
MSMLLLLSASPLVPVFTLHPVSATLPAKSMFTLSASAIGKPTIVYTWEQFVGVPGFETWYLLESEGNTYTFEVQGGTSIFRCIANNPYGQAISNEAIITGS